jgi:hypothetical protein
MIEIEIRLPAAKECQELPETRRVKEGFSRIFRENMVLLIN